MGVTDTEKNRHQTSDLYLKWSLENGGGFKKKMEVVKIKLLRKRDSK
jgi:hypothetical protein